MKKYGFYILEPHKTYFVSPYNIVTADMELSQIETELDKYLNEALKKLKQQEGD